MIKTTSMTPLSPLTLLRLLAITPIHLYRWCISPLLGPSCRYLPTCSDYAAQAITRHGIWRGGALAVGRLSRCHPWGSHGFDPVPEPPDPRTGKTGTAHD